jgi:predicted XRE-type DNA-binding protein
LDFLNADQELIKAELTAQIYRLLKKMELSKDKAAKLLGATEKQVMALMLCRPVTVPVDRLKEFLRKLSNKWNYSS